MEHKSSNPSLTSTIDSLVNMLALHGLFWEGPLCIDNDIWRDRTRSLITNTCKPSTLTSAIETHTIMWFGGGNVSHSLISDKLDYIYRVHCLTCINLRRKSRQISSVCKVIAWQQQVSGITGLTSGESNKHHVLWYNTTGIIKYHKLLSATRSKQIGEEDNNS